MTLKRISDEEIERGYHSACDVCRWHPCSVGSCKPSDRAIAQAQLAADEEVIAKQLKAHGDICFNAGKLAEKKALKEAHNAVIKEIKEGLENTLVSTFDGGEGVVFSISKFWWQAFWQKYGVKNGR
ncbi:hypothetical protein LCGC14_0396460 [marine sediment metagenome]|uniref:Uncharacterized protein n=1 Tax=marine sediment metagenome TaxID=412755 RepID=A0A0F9T3W8_9ZZZZ